MNLHLQAVGWADLRETVTREQRWKRNSLRLTTWKTKQLKMCKTIVPQNITSESRRKLPSVILGSTLHAHWCLDVDETSSWGEGSVLPRAGSRRDLALGMLLSTPLPIAGVHWRVQVPEKLVLCAAGLDRHGVCYHFYPKLWPELVSQIPANPCSIPVLL